MPETKKAPLSIFKIHKLSEELELRLKEIEDNIAKLMRRK
tara:strand:- start:18 stop:137 length:120 start_codon:yes stop_codon:yes gene_type:complete